MKKTTVKEVISWLKTLEEYRYRKVYPVDARRIARYVNEGENTELPQSLQKKTPGTTYGRERYLAKAYLNYQNRLKQENLEEMKLRKAIRKVIKEKLNRG